MTSRRVAGAVLFLVLAVAGVLRALRFDLRFNQITFAYSAYYQPVTALLEAGQWGQGLTRFVGLHPPFYSLVHAALYEVWGAPGGYLLVSGVFSVASVWAVYDLGRQAFDRWTGLVAAGLLAVSVYHLHYSLEVNNYPLTVLLSALTQTAFVRLLRRPDRRGLTIWALFTVLSVYAHALAAVVAALHVLVSAICLDRRHRQSLALAVCGVGTMCLPLVPPVVGILVRTGTYQNDSMGVGALWTLVARGMASRFGPDLTVVLLIAVAVAGAWRGLTVRHTRRPAIALVTTFGLAPFIAVFILAGVAAAEQYPYYLLLLPSIVVLAARGVPVSGLWAWRRPDRFLHAAALPCLAFVFSTKLMFGRAELAQARDQLDAYERAPHAIRVAIDSWDEDQALWLLAPPIHPDDDKLSVDPVYQALPRWTRCSYYQPESIAFEYVDYSYGQPVRCDGRLLYSFTDVYPSRMAVLLRHHRFHAQSVRIVLYDIDREPEYLSRLEDVLAPFDGQGHAVGETFLFVVPAQEREEPGKVP